MSVLAPRFVGKLAREWSVYVLCLLSTSAERREQHLHLNHLQQNAFRNERIVHQVRLMRLEHELQLAACTATITNPFACTATMGQLCLELKPAQIVAMRSAAKLEKTCLEIHMYFESTSAAILAGQQADDGSTDIRWVNETVRRVETQRMECAADWQRTADDVDTVGGSVTDRRLVEVRAQLAELKGRIELHTEVGRVHGCLSGCGRLTHRLFVHLPHRHSRCASACNGPDTRNASRPWPTSP